MNFSTHKIRESAHVRIDEFVEESNKEPKDYRRFVYYEPNTLPKLSKRKEASSPKSLETSIVIEM